MANVGTGDLFWRERELLEEANALLKESTASEVCRDKYATLAEAYAELLKQMSQLTRLSDKQQMRMTTLLERLSRYVPPPLYRKITTGKEKVEINKTKRVKLTIFFSDIVEFSQHSSEMEGEALSTILNSYLEEMTNIINKHGGTLDKYIGDAILVFFGDPDFTDDYDHAHRCLTMAIEMRRRMAELQQQWFDLGYPEPLKIRMGISTGFVSVGNFGSSERMDYTIIGTPVNLASRLQTAAGADQILISHETWSFVKDMISCSEPLHLNLKGFPKTVVAYEVHKLKPNEEHSDVVVEDKDRELYLRFDKNKISKDELIQIIEQGWL